MIEPDRDEPEPDIIDTILDRQLVLRQPRTGHRAGTDAVLLAAACRVEPGDKLVDVGSGVGTVGLALALREPSATGFLLDSDAALSAFAGENCRLNKLGSRLVPVTANLFDAAERRAGGIIEGQADLVVTNPPFYTGAESQVPQAEGKARAYVLDGGSKQYGHADWLREAASLLAPKGRFYAIYRPEAVPELLAACEGRLSGLVLTPVYAKAANPAIRVLISGRKGGKEPMKIGRSLVLHEADGRFTPEAEAIHRGQVGLPT